MADSKVSALSELSVPDLNDDEYAVDNTGPTSYKLGFDRKLGLVGLIPGGRLTLTTAVPVTTADVTAAGTLYYTLYVHDRIRIFDGTRWIYYSFTEKSLALTLTSGKNYDVFIYDNAGTLTLELSAAWTNDTTRADALTTQDGVQVKSGATTRLWLGTIRASGTNTTEDSVAKRFVWNAYNQAFRKLFISEATATWTYTTDTWRQANGSSTNQVAMIIGRQGTSVEISVRAGGINDGGNAFDTGIGFDSSSVVAANCLISRTTAAGLFSQVAFLRDLPAIGYHFYAWLERSDTGGTTTWTGEYGTNITNRAGITGWVQG